MTAQNFSQNILSKQGLLSQVIQDFEFRPEQQKMAEKIEATLLSSKKLIVEAGTGTGKTFAYLVPAVLLDGKVIISTGTKNLQDQLFFKDLPIILNALKSTKKTVLLKGRSNYLCPYHLERNLLEGRFFSRDTIKELRLVQQWSAVTKKGDITELSELPEDAAVWPLVTSTGDNCLGHTCPHYAKCPVMKARQQAQSADIIVVNHALFMSDLKLKESDQGELLPDVKAIIFDEAHQLPQVATNYFGDTISSRQMLELSRDLLKEYYLHVSDVGEVKVVAEKLEKSIKNFRLVLSPTKQRASWLDISHKIDVKIALQHLLETLEDVGGVLAIISSRSQELQNILDRVKVILLLLKTFKNSESKNNIFWFETFTKNFTLNVTPIDIAQAFMNSMSEHQCPWIFTSATLAVKSDFHYFADRLGLKDAETLQLPSSFNFDQQALLYIPARLPEPRSPNYTASIVEAMIPVLQASQGRAFFLFTSFRALYEAEELLTDKLHYPLLVQGTKPKSQLLEEFRELGNAILLGTSSFWEGVDVRGEALSCVIIDKLPFESPGDPILKARINIFRERGLDPFNEYQIPHAVINLKQGIGRLIRDHQDKGVLVICDPRVIQRSYGSIFINSLPKMPLTRDLVSVTEFFK